jgi:hypothetical protein
MRNLVWFLDVVELSSLYRFPVLIRLRTPPVDLVGTRWAEDLHARRSVREVVPELFVNVEIPSRGGVEAGEDSLLVAACLLRLAERAVVLARRAVPGFSTRHSPKQFRLRQHVVLLCLKVKKTTTYYNAVDELTEMPCSRDVDTLRELPATCCLRASMRTQNQQ